MRFAKHCSGLSLFGFRNPFMLGLGLAFAVTLLTGCSGGDETASDGSTDPSADGSGGQSQDGAAPPNELIVYAPTDLTTTCLVDASNQPVHQWESEYKAG